MINECVQGGIADTLTVSDRFMIGHLSLLPPITTGSYSFTMGYKNKMAKK